MFHTLQRPTMSCQNLFLALKEKPLCFNIFQEKGHLWMLVESATGHVLQINVYQGKRFDPSMTGTLQRITVIMKLMSDSQLLGKGLHVFAEFLCIA